MNSNTGYIKSLDGLRAIAIILVMSFHTEITHFGWFGVQLFFVLSGFLITGILWNEKQNDSPIGYKFKKFWVRRSLRIFPLYFGYLLFLSITFSLFTFPSHFSSYSTYLFTYTFNYTRLLPQWPDNLMFSHLWSLSIEEQFYLLFPLIVYLCPPKFTKALMVIIIAISPVTRFLLGEYYAAKGLPETVVADAVYWNTLSHLDAFFIGGAIPVFALHKKIKKPVAVFSTALIIAIIAGAINFINTDSGSYYFNDLGYNHGQTKLYEHVWHYTVLDILFAALILGLVSTNRNKFFTAIRNFLEAKWMVRIGKVSYGMYVFHWAILGYVVNRLFETENIALKVLFFIPYILIVYLLAELSFRLYESKFLKFKDSLFTKNKDDKTKVQVISSVADTSSVLKQVSND